MILPLVKTAVGNLADISGRTGRAGAEGHAITLFTELDKAQSGG